MSIRLVSIVMLALLLIGILAFACDAQLVKASIQSYEWIDPTYTGFDPFFQHIVVAYRTGSVAKIVVTVSNDWYMILNISVVKLTFDWGMHYLSIEASPEDPFELPSGETCIFNISLTVPPISIASDRFLHTFEIRVEHVDANHNTISMWVIHGNNFAVYPPSPDINGDGVVNMDDLLIAVHAFGAFPTHPRWNPLADINSDGRVTLGDIVTVLTNFGKRNP